MRKTPAKKRVAGRRGGVKNVRQTRRTLKKESNDAERDKGRKETCRRGAQGDRKDEQDRRVVQGKKEEKREESKKKSKNSGGRARKVEETKEKEIK